MPKNAHDKTKALKRKAIRRAIRYRPGMVGEDAKRHERRKSARTNKREFEKHMTPAQKAVVGLLANLKTRCPELEYESEHIWYHPTNLDSYYTIDIMVLEPRQLAIEIDGSAHNAQADARRDGHLAEHGVKTLRIKNSDVGNSQAVKEKIATTLGIQCT